jgi:hypothetical protein
MKPKVCAVFVFKTVGFDGRHLYRISAVFCLGSERAGAIRDMSSSSVAQNRYPFFGILVIFAAFSCQRP